LHCLYLYDIFHSVICQIGIHQNKGVPLRCPRTGGLGQGQHLLWRRILLCKIRSPNPPKKRPAQARARRKGGVGGIPPALQILGEICSNFFERTPPIGKCLCWLAFCEGSPADFKHKLEFFIFAPLLRGWPKVGFPNFHF